MVSRNDIRQDPMIQKITAELGEEPYWIKQDNYELYWKWIHDTTIISVSFTKWCSLQQNT